MHNFPWWMHFTRNISLEKIFLQINPCFIIIRPFWLIKHVFTVQEGSLLKMLVMSYNRGVCEICNAEANSLIIAHCFDFFVQSCKDWNSSGTSSLTDWCESTFLEVFSLYYLCLFISAVISFVRHRAKN